MTRTSRMALALLFTCIMMGGCSEEPQKEKEPGKIEQQTQQIAEQAIEQIRTPINKAQGVEQVQEDYERRLKEQLESTQ